jgi:hypothetical protein
MILSPKPGKLRVARVYRVRCAVCEETYEMGEVEADHRLDAMRMLGLEGWRHTRLLGWVCPRCAGRA